MNWYKKTKWYIKSLFHIFTGSGYCHQAEKKIESEYYKNTPPHLSNNTLQGIIVMVDGRYLQGGLTDRLKGITSVYSYCKEHHIPFKLNFTNPFSLETYLVPNKVDWRISPDSICYDLNKVKVRLLNDYEIPVAFHSLCLHKWLKDGKQLHLYTNTHFRDEDFHACFHELFKPSLKLQKQLDFCKEKLGGKYISISYRFTTLLGDFKDCINTPLPEKDQEVLIQKCLDVVERIVAIAPEHNKILITADSAKFLARASKLPNVYIVEGQIGHFDYECNEDKEMKTFLDYLLIAGAEAVYLARTGNMYNSAFARHAAKIGNKPFTDITF